MLMLWFLKIELYFVWKPCDCVLFDYLLHRNSVSIGKLKQKQIINLTLPRCCWQSSLRSASWRSTWSRPQLSWRVAGGPRLWPSSSDAVMTSGPWRLRHAGYPESCGHSPPRSGRQPAGKGGHTEAWRKGLSKAARMEQSETVTCMVGQRSERGNVTDGGGGGVWNV